MIWFLVLFMGKNKNESFEKRIEGIDFGIILHQNSGQGEF